MKTAIQIGTNKSGDEFFDICKEESFDLILLIEPAKRFNDIIHEIYKGFNHKIFNIAITSKDIKVAKLYNLHESGEMDSLSKRKTHPIRETTNDLEYTEVPCMTFNSFCEKHQIKNVELLQIDIEGLDDEVLLSIDMEKVSIKRIIWENWDHDDDDENGIYRTGSDIQKEVRSKLESKGFTVSDLSTRDFCAVKDI